MSNPTNTSTATSDAVPATASETVSEARVLAVFRAAAHATEEDFAKVIDAELARAAELADQGVIVHGWGRTDCVGAALVVAAATVEAARAVLATLPAVAAGLVEAEALVPLVPLPLSRG